MLSNERIASDDGRIRKAEAWALWWDFLFELGRKAKARRLAAEAAAQPAPDPAPPAPEAEEAGRERP
jgi:hypothetical protein